MKIWMEIDGEEKRVNIPLWDIFLLYVVGWGLLWAFMLVVYASFLIGASL